MTTRMDPQLFEELARGRRDGEIDAIIRLWPGRAAPDQVRIVSRFGDIATCRLRRRDIVAVRRDPATRSLKASRTLNNDKGEKAGGTRGPARKAEAIERRPDLRETGRGVVIGIVDYGCDFAHHAFRSADGGSRILKLWDQRPDPGSSRAIEPYRRGRVFDQADLDRALNADDPYGALGYHPAPNGEASARRGSHGTHVLDIAAGNGRGRAPSGMAPDADIVFVHVASGDTGGLRNFGDSVGVLEAIDFIAKQAGDRPCVINISMGRHGGPHDGSTLTELAIDNLLARRNGLSLVQSAGNYFGRDIHASGVLRDGSRAHLGWLVRDTRRGGSELEIWYPGRDEALVTIEDPDRDVRITLRPGDRREIRIDGQLVGRAYARIGDPGNRDNHIDIFLYRGAPVGTWRVSLTGRRIHNGRWHAWIERDSASRQSYFTRGPVSDSVTCGTIAHGRAAIQVAAHDGRDEPRPTAFSSAGPSRDGRSVPMIAAPGLHIAAARSAVPGETNDHRELTRKSGTSMAAPFVTGLVALMLEAAPDASQRDLRALLRRSARPMPARERSDAHRAHWGAVDPGRAVAFARRWQASRQGTAPAAGSQSFDQIAELLQDLPVAAQASPVEPIESETCENCGPQSAAESNSENYFTPSAADWAIVANWVARRLVPTDGSGMLPANRTPAAAIALPAEPGDAARAVATALMRHSLTTSSWYPIPMQGPSSIDLLARQVLPAMPPSVAEWREVGAFMEAQTSANRSSSATRRLFGADDAANRRNIAYHLACARLQSWPGAIQSSPYCSYPTGTPNPAIQMLARQLTSAGPLVDWPQLSLAVRSAYVMHRLITVHRYSREAAAGIVGNLDAESGVLPERVEGSSHTTPRYALGKNGHRSRHSAADIMNRRSRPPLGPKRPGIGLAQWTSSGRRNGLFAHSQGGIAPGEYVIYFMDHQIDYLAHELATAYRRVDRVLRRSGVSVDDASDEVIYNFERPGSVLEPDPNRPGRKRLRPRSDPQVQEKFRARRRRSHRALDAYNRAYPPPRIPRPTQSEQFAVLPETVPAHSLAPDPASRASHHGVSA